MSEKPEALRLANSTHLAYRVGWQREAAAELRRLHQFAEDHIGRATAAEAALQMTKTTHALKIAAVEAQRDALLEELAVVLLEAEHTLLEPTRRKARAAIKAVEEGK